MAVFNSLFLVVTCVLCAVFAEDKDIAEYFKACKKRTPSFDPCMKKALNSIRHLFKTGLPEYGVLPFDPFFAKEVVQKRGGPNLNYRLRLLNTYEKNWSNSFVDSFRGDLDNNQIIYSQYFPEKFVNGEYVMEANMLQYPIHNKGSWNLSLYDYNQTTTITRRAAVLPDGRVDFSGPLKVQVVVTHIGDMSLHVGNLLRGRPFMEGLLDQMINAGWKPVLPLVTPLVNDLVSTAFTAIFNQDFKNFPFDKVFPD